MYLLLNLFYLGNAFRSCNDLVYQTVLPIMKMLYFNKHKTIFISSNNNDCELSLSHQHRRRLNQVAYKSVCAGAAVSWKRDKPPATLHLLCLRIISTFLDILTN